MRNKDGEFPDQTPNELSPQKQSPMYLPTDNDDDILRDLLADFLVDGYLPDPEFPTETAFERDQKAKANTMGSQPDLRPQSNFIEVTEKHQHVRDIYTPTKKLQESPNLIETSLTKCLPPPVSELRQRATPHDLFHRANLPQNNSRPVAPRKRHHAFTADVDDTENSPMPKRQRMQDVATGSKDGSQLSSCSRTLERRPVPRLPRALITPAPPPIARQISADGSLIILDGSDAPRKSSTPLPQRATPVSLSDQYTLPRLRFPNNTVNHSPEKSHPAGIRSPAAKPLLNANARQNHLTTTIDPILQPMPVLIPNNSQPPNHSQSIDPRIISSHHPNNSQPPNHSQSVDPRVILSSQHPNNSQPPNHTQSTNPHPPPTTNPRPQDYRFRRPSTAIEAQHITDALLLTRLDFLRRTSFEAPRTRNTHSYAEQHNVIQEETKSVWLLDSAPPPVLCKLGVWTGGFDNWHGMKVSSTLEVDGLDIFCTGAEVDGASGSSGSDGTEGMGRNAVLSALFDEFWS
ncbi:hypothetical protein MMC07_000960 [Pseudocyphellaria aurata]|nr:hypothetical protein [Pseudocyphellaria aurata]